MKSPVQLSPQWSAQGSAWAELLRVSAVFSVPGDALAGAAALAVRPHRGTLLAAAASLCLYEAGMVLNDWADRAQDAVERPHRPIPSGRIAPGAALAASCALTAGGLALAARAGRPTLALATALTATVWAYDLKLKHTAAAPGAMAAARALDVLMGAVGTAGVGGLRQSGRGSGLRGSRPSPPGVPLTARSAGLPDVLAAALPTAAVMGVHTYAVTEVSRHEAQGGSSRAPLAALATAGAVASVVGAAAKGAARSVAEAVTQGRRPGADVRDPLPLLAAGAFAAVYLRTAATPLLHAALHPSPPLTQRAVGGGIRAMIPLQAGLAARSGAAGTGAALLLMAPLARRLARKVSPT
ncbi:SCO3242 family prenyltransferase [Streptomyces sp. NPDC051561]|uniref:SCO3242 family prenyltransferase n=1 Tax=Streptomyces sp. NPDC051561 TaxID=3365658 RepID=UPI0037B8BCC9